MWSPEDLQNQDIQGSLRVGETASAITPSRTMSKPGKQLEALPL